MLLGVKMNRIFLLLFFVVSVSSLAQENVESDSSNVTPEGYRIINIDELQKTTSKDSVDKQKKEPINFHFSIGPAASFSLRSVYGNPDGQYYEADSSITLLSGYSFELGVMMLFPLNKQHFALKTGTLFKYTSLLGKDAFYIKEKSGSVETLEYGTRNLRETSIVFPLLFVAKTKTFPIALEAGTKISIPLTSECGTRSGKGDLIDLGARNSPDYAIALGLSYLATTRFSIDVNLEIQLNDAYSSDFFVGMSDVRYVELEIKLFFSIF